MGPLTILALAVALALDAFSVAAATSVSLGKLTGRQIFRFSFHFGLFQAGMPLLGFLSGNAMVDWVKAWDHWLAFALLALVGGKAIWEGLRQDPHGHHDTWGHHGADGHQGSHAAGATIGKAKKPKRDATQGWSLVILSLATSIDAFAVGLSFAWLEVSPWLPALVIGLVTASLTAAGMQMGSRLGRRFGPRMGILGGLVLIAIGVKIVVDHIG